VPGHVADYLCLLARTKKTAGAKAGRFSTLVTDVEALFTRSV